MNKLINAILFLPIVVLVGCAAPIMAPQENDIAAKDFLPAKNRASIYIYRNENFGAAIGMPVTVNGRGIGETGAKTFFRLDLPAGAYTVGSHAENYSDTNLKAEEGKNYFVWQEVKMGIWKARSELKQVDEKTGRIGVLESKLLTSLVPNEELVASDNKLANTNRNEVSQASQKLRELQRMLNEKLITEGEYQEKKKQILDSM